jgi:hypothetical protein
LQLGGAEEHHDCAKSELFQSLREAGLSASVIETAERGMYTDDQLQKLKMQKSELKQAIQDVIVGNQINAMAAQLATPTTQTPSNTDGTFSSLPEKEQLVPACTFRACHTCRPYYRDRVYASIPSIIFSQQRPLNPDDVSVLPTKNARVLRNIGLLPNPVPTEIPRDDEPLSPTTLPTSTDGTGTGTRDTGNITPSRASILTFRTTQTDLSTVQRLSNPRKRFYSLGSRSSRSVPGDLGGAPSVARKFKSAIRGMFNPRAESRKRIKTRVSTPRKLSKSGHAEKDKGGEGKRGEKAENGDVGLASIHDTEQESSTITLPLPGTGTARNITSGQSGEKVGEFDVGTLRRIRRQNHSADLRNGVYAGGHQRIRISNKKSKGKSVRKSQRNAERKTPVSHRHSQSVNGTVDTRATPTIIGQKQRKNRNGTPFNGTRAASVSMSSGSVDEDTSSNSESDFSVYSCSSEGEEVEVNGGVALTEEAGETHTPDILDMSKRANGNADLGLPLPLPLPLAGGGIALPNGGFQFNGTGVRKVEGEETGDLGLQSIMAQV